MALEILFPGRARLQGVFTDGEGLPWLPSHQLMSRLSLKCPSCSGEEDAGLAQQDSPGKGFNSP